MSAGFILAVQGFASSLRSKTYKPLVLMLIGMDLSSIVLCSMPCRVSMVAPMALNKVFDSKNGV